METRNIKGMLKNLIILDMSDGIFYSPINFFCKIKILKKQGKHNQFIQEISQSSIDFLELHEYTYLKKIPASL